MSHDHARLADDIALNVASVEHEQRHIDGVDFITTTAQVWIAGGFLTFKETSRLIDYKAGLDVEETQSANLESIKVQVFRVRGEKVQAFLNAGYDANIEPEPNSVEEAIDYVAECAKLRRSEYERQCRDYVKNKATK